MDHQCDIIILNDNGLSTDGVPHARNLRREEIKKCKHAEVDTKLIRASLSLFAYFPNILSISQSFKHKGPNLSGNL